jgi:hypothetical protein
VRIRIEAIDLPGASCGPGSSAPGGHGNVHVGVQRRAHSTELLGLVRGDAPSVSRTLDCTATPSAAGIDLGGPYIQGPPGGRFIYLSWVDVGETGEPTMFRRAKLWLEALPTGTVERAIDDGVLVARLRLTDGRGGPLSASVRPPLVTWSAERSDPA